MAFGEVGIDLSTNSISLEVQESALIELLKEFKADILAKDLPVVLHCRNSRGRGSFSEYDYDATLSAMNVVETILGNAQMLQLHYFNGDAAEVSMWLDRFPYTYFSIPVRIGMPQSERQKNGWLKIPRERLLLESDAPHGAIEGSTSPYDLPQDCGPLARALGISKRELLHLAYENARHFFRI